MSLSEFVSDLDPAVAKRTCVIREDAITTRLAPGVDQHPACSRKTRYLIRAEDVAAIFNIPDGVKSISAVIYDDHMHMRSLPTKDRHDPGSSKTDLFIDDRGFMRVLARLVVGSSSPRGSLSSKRFETTSEHRENEGVNDAVQMEVENKDTNVKKRRNTAKKGEEKNGDADVDDGAKGGGKEAEMEDQEEEEENDDGEVEHEEESAAAPMAPQLSDARKKQKRKMLCRKPFVLLSEDGNRVQRVYADAADLVIAGHFRSVAQANNRLKRQDGGGKVVAWNVCPAQARQDYLRRGNPMPIKNSKCKPVEQVRAGNVERRYTSITEVSGALGEHKSSVYRELKRAISQGTTWNGFHWRFAGGSEKMK